MIDVDDTSLLLPSPRDNPSHDDNHHGITGDDGGMTLWESKKPKADEAHDQSLMKVQWNCVYKLLIHKPALFVMMTIDDCCY